MYIAFMLILSDMKKVNLKYFGHVVNALLNCKQNNIVHLFISATYNLHHLDSHLKKFKIFHIKSSPKSEIDQRNDCYHNLVMKSDFEYHWIINVRPDVLIFDTNIFYNIRQKFDPNFIHARARYYIGPKVLSKNEKSFWKLDDEADAFKFSKTTDLIILDNNIFLVPQSLSYRVFKNTNNANLGENKHFETVIQSLEKTQSLIWYNENIPLNIAYLVFVPPEKMLSYNMIES